MSWKIVYTYSQKEQMIKDGYVEWETDTMKAWYTKEGSPTLFPITGGYGWQTLEEFERHTYNNASSRR